MSDAPKSDPSTKHQGSDFDDFLAEEDLLDEAEAVATKRVLAFSSLLSRHQAAPQGPPSR